MAYEHTYFELFERTAASHATRVAARCLDRSVTHAELIARVTRAGAALRACGVQVDDTVGIVMERGIDFLVAVLAVFEAGAAYLPLDPKIPTHRMEVALASAGARLLLTSRAVQSRAAEVAGVRSLLAEDLEQVTCVGARPRPRTCSRNLAYVISTSGSTGVPKGVMVEQGGMLNNQLSKIPYLGLTYADVVAQTASQGFDISVWQLLTPLLCGGCVEIVPDEIAQDPRSLMEHVVATRATVLECVPAIIQGMLNGDAVQLPSVRWLLATGEALPPALAQAWIERYPFIPIVNAYGPAECSDDVALHIVERSASSGGDVRAPIGVATDNNQLYVLDANGDLAAPGAIGELYVGGPRRWAWIYRLAGPHGRGGSSRIHTASREASACIAPEIWRATNLTASSNSSDAPIIRSRFAAFGSSSARSKRSCALRLTCARQRSSRGTVLTARDWWATSCRRTAAVDVASIRERLARTLPDYMVPSAWMLLGVSAGKRQRQAGPKSSAGTRHATKPVGTSTRRAM